MLSSSFGGTGAGGVASNNNNNANANSVASSPSALSSRASLDSARGSADVRTLLWRASMPGECVLISLLPFCARKLRRERAEGGEYRAAGRCERRGADLAKGNYQAREQHELSLDHSPPRATPLTLYILSSACTIDETSMSRVERAMKRVGRERDEATGRGGEKTKRFSIRFFFPLFFSLFSFLQPRVERREKRKAKMGPRSGLSSLSRAVNSWPLPTPPRPFAFCARSIANASVL